MENSVQTNQKKVYIAPIIWKSLRAAEKPRCHYQAYYSSLSGLLYVIFIQNTPHEFLGVEGRISMGNEWWLGDKVPDSSRFISTLLVKAAPISAF